MGWKDRGVKFGSVCSGIEAASVAWEPLGWKAAWFSEIEKFPCAVLAHHYPDTPNLGDMTTLPARIAAGEVEAPDLFCGGTPCQAFSVAGLRQSLEDARGNLSLTFCEIADAIDHVRVARGEPASIVFWENVPGVLSTKDNAFGCFLGALAGTDTAIVPGGRWTDAGVVDGPKRTVAWRTLDAQYFGVAQRRRRVFVVASARADFDPAAVLFEFEGVRRDTAPSRKTGKAVARSAAFSAGNSSNARSIGYIEEGTPPLRAGASGTNQVPTCITQPYPIANTLTARMHKGINSTLDEGQTPVMQPIAFSGQMSNPHTDVDIMQTLQAKNPMAVAQPIAFDGYNQTLSHTSQTIRADKSDGDHIGMVLQAMQVRRLTPVECERLQGFPDNYTNIKDKCPDGPRYKALGNSWAVPVVRWIGDRIDRALDRL